MSDSQCGDQSYVHGNLRIPMKDSFPWELSRPSLHPRQSASHPSVGVGGPTPCKVFSSPQLGSPAWKLTDRGQGSGLTKNSRSLPRSSVWLLTSENRTVAKADPWCPGRDCRCMGTWGPRNTCCSSCLRGSLDSFWRKNFYSVCWQLGFCWLRSPNWG